jgi:hypothetical protein
LLDLDWHAVLRIGIVLMPIRIRLFYFDADPDPTFHFDAGPDPDPGARKLTKISKYT